ncbi:hypothetical protein [Photobacterium gaetbulicola]|uniref:hypothetical protein n=1 Tax=Photobacterium gaetbulicola TaxID=1295392 RepID=UPI001B8017FB|nr:hypothetical protein [Photobacterium gaetbulicola]
MTGPNSNGSKNYSFFLKKEVRLENGLWAMGYGLWAMGYGLKKVMVELKQEVPGDH